MTQPINILLQTTIEPTENDWHIGRFSMLRDYLASLTTPDGAPLFRVTARDRDPVGASDSVLSSLDRSNYDELWLFAVDVGNGLNDEDRAGILRFRARGGGIMITRDHMDLGCSICDLGVIGAAHVFHTHNAGPTIPPPDDKGTPQIGWPNFHSGANGAAQRVEAVLPVHPVMREVTFLPAHPHEGAVVAPASAPHARVIATGQSLASGQRFNISIAFERTESEGPAIAESTFHHFADYNWDPRRGSPDFVSETPVYELPSSPAMASVHNYVRNVALWLGGRALTSTSAVV
ncbi:hypothetical protein GCM10011487_47800 [Steroidobacter agaridevorans]|uniref:ThuA-like domain-containing protein n=1 Tax=Steroidobacter agaridevorans TaxID=2695856 RepID=A0A829YHR3_9GAMM|nr:hypothetical protein [Steroidobacter agaridevorans]GFE82780.1 hypothetical protein GCM10011487_47800 [Steroidobacter agaridevorans]